MTDEIQKRQELKSQGGGKTNQYMYKSIHNLFSLSDDK
jgi:hypothetical protein